MATTWKEVEARHRELQKEAESFVINAGITAPPVDPLIWCSDKDLISVRETDLRGECDGLLRYHGGRFHLFYDPGPLRWRFNLGHEVAHYLIDEHHQAIRSGTGAHKSFSGFIRNTAMEREADWFASALLMPRQLFQPKCPDPSFKGISKIAREFDVSLTSAALRTVFFSTDVRTALVVTERGRIAWYSLSEGLVYSGIHGVKKGAAPPAGSKTAEVYRSLANMDTEPIEGGKCAAAEWFTACHDDIVLWEEVLPLPRFQQIFTLLTAYDD